MAARFLQRAVRSRAINSLTRKHPLKNPAKSEALSSASNRGQERGNSNRPSAAALASPSRCQPDAGCEWDCPRSQGPG
jgi:hypothetical protein